MSPEHAYDVVVLGRSLPALLTALDLTEVALSVCVVGATDDVPRGPVHDPDGALAAALTRIATPIGGHEPTSTEAAAVPRVTPARRVWLRARDGQWAPQPAPSTIGIPAVPLSQESLRLLGSSGAMRAYLDRVMPLLTVGKTRVLGRLVKKRIGARAASILVEPIVFERYGVSADEVDVAVAAPGLNETLSRTGSLTSAVLAYATRNEHREQTVEPSGGWERTLTELRARLESYGVVFIDDDAELVDRTAEGWRIRTVQQLDVRSAALVVDVTAEGHGTPDGAGAPAGIGVLADLLRDIQPSLARTYAEIEIYSPSEIDDDAIAVGVQEGLSVALGPASSDRRRAVLAGPAEHRRERRALGADAEQAAQDIGTGAYEAALHGIGWRIAPDSEWRTETRAAQFLTLDERHGAEQRLHEVREREPALLPVGAALHGGVLAEGVAWAGEQAVRLRRRLLGLDGDA